MPEDIDEQPTEEQAERHQKVVEVLAEIDAVMTPELRALLNTDDLYDEDGLPA